LPRPESKVRNGGLVLDEPTNLPEGTEVTTQLVDPDDLTDQERAAIHASLERGLADLEAGRVVDHARIKEVLRATRARP
jgi:predicted transcriptional regulator